MFTGIIKGRGVVTAILPHADPVYVIQSGLPLENVEIGASIACNGVCLTVIAKTGNTFQVQVSPETLAKTTLSHWQVGTKINLERPLQAGDEFGGHMVSGHVDGVTAITGRVSEGGTLRFRFALPDALRRFIAPKGSVTLDGVSLTINEVEVKEFGVAIIPHTQQETNFGELVVGDKMNVEVDMMARYLDRLLEQRGL